MIKKENIFIGQVLECTDLYRYERDGEKSIIPLFQVGSMTESEEFDNIRIADTYALLIKQDENYLYVPINGERILLNTSPSNENKFFVKESTLKSYYDVKEHNKKISKRKLVKEYICDSRIPMGIDN